MVGGVQTIRGFGFVFYALGIFQLGKSKGRS